MLRLDKVIKPWKEAAALNDHINLYGFWNESAFLTKSGDLGMVLRVSGVDYESLDHAEQEYAVKRLESALKAFGPGFHVYQYLFKQNRPVIPFAHYEDPVVEAAIDQRRQFFEAKRDRLYQIEIFYCIVLEGERSKTGIGAALGRLFSDPAGAIDELKTQFAGSRMKKLLRAQIENSVAILEQRVQAFTRQLGDFIEIRVLSQPEQFTFFRRLLNYDDLRITGKPQSTQFLDYQVVNSTIEAERDHLRVGDHLIRVLTMKEAITETRPLVLDSLLRVAANFYVVTEWTPLGAEQARKEVNKRRRHFNVSKTGFISQMGNDASKTNPRDVLVDESKQADIENLGDCLRALSDGQQLGDFSLTIVLYGRSKSELEHLAGEFTGVFTNADGNLFVETYNQLNAYFATVPGNYALSRAIGKVEIERMKETHFDGSRTGRNFSLDRQTEPLVLDSEISGLENLHAYLKHGNYVARFSFPVLEVPPSKPKFIERLEDDYIVRKPKTAQPEPPKNDVPMTVTTVASNGHATSNIATKPADDAPEEAQTTLPFGTGI